MVNYIELIILTFVDCVFMGGFFLTFSFFKMLDLKGFSDSYQMYDIIAQRFKTWGIIYAFMETFLKLSPMLCSCC